MEIELRSWHSDTRLGSRVNRRRTGARTALSASSSDLILADMAVRAPIDSSWRASTIPESRIGTMNPIVLVLVLVLVLETKLAGRGRVRERGRGRRDSSWRGRSPWIALITGMHRS